MISEIRAVWQGGETVAWMMGYWETFYWNSIMLGTLYVTEWLVRKGWEFNRRLHVTKFCSVFFFFLIPLICFFNTFGCLMIVDLEDIEEHFPLMFLSVFWKEHLSAPFAVCAHSSKHIASRCSCLCGSTIKLFFKQCILCRL